MTNLAIRVKKPGLAISPGMLSAVAILGVCSAAYLFFVSHLLIPDIA